MQTSQLRTLVDERANGRISRRGFMNGTMALGLTAAASTWLLAACGGGDSAPPSEGSSTGTLRVAYFAWIENVAPWLDELKTRFEADNAGVTVEYSPLAVDITNSDALVQRFALEARQDEASVDLILGATPFVDVGALAKANALAPIADLAPDLIDRLPASVASEITAADGVAYALPFWTDAVGFLARQDLLTTAGATVPTSWDELEQTAAALAGSLESGSYAYGADWTQIHRLFLPIMAANSDSLFDDRGLIDVGSDAALEALERLQRLQALMPPGADKPMGSAEVFQANKLVMETYWQAQYARSLESGIAEDALSFTGNLAGSTQGTVFWNTCGVIPKASPMAEMAAKFVSDGLLSDWGLEQSVAGGRVCPVADLPDRVELPAWLQSTFDQLETGTPIPCNDAFFAVEQPTFQTEVGRMVLEGQSAADTQAALVAAFDGYEA